MARQIIHPPDPIRKIPAELDSPVDNVLLLGVRATVAFYRNLGLTPNGITTLSLLTGLTSAWLLYRQWYLASSGLYLISYYYDCMDGYMARKYSLTSNLGDIYDHIKDYVTGVLIIYLLYVDYRAASHLFALLAIPFFLITSSIHIGGQEVYYGKKNHNTTLSLFIRVSMVSDKASAARQMRLTRFFSTGSLTIAICSLIAALAWLR